MLLAPPSSRSCMNPPGHWRASERAAITSHSGRLISCSASPCSTYTRRIHPHIHRHIHRLTECVPPVEEALQTSEFRLTPTTPEWPSRSERAREETTPAGELRVLHPVPLSCDDGRRVVQRSGGREMSPDELERKGAGMPSHYFCKSM